VQIRIFNLAQAIEDQLFVKFCHMVVIIPLN
jgi:hypothetical protein